MSGVPGAAPVLRKACGVHDQIQRPGSEVAAVQTGEGDELRLHTQFLGTEVSPQLLFVLFLTLDVRTAAVGGLFAFLTKASLLRKHPPYHPCWVLGVS